MSTPIPSKRGLVDFLWEWGEANGDWGKLLVCLIVNSESQLSPTDRQSVFDYFLQDAGLKSGLQALNISKPTYAPSGKRLLLLSLSNVKGVNRLAKDQTMSFGKNVTVIYGENGSGKTGYGRILKALGFSYDASTQIFCNVFDNPEQQGATIRYKVNDAEHEFNWVGKGSNADLSNISVFNNHCVSISLAAGRGLLVSPIGFHLFALITSELSYLMAMLEQMINEHPTTSTWINQLTLGTPQYNYLQNLKSTSDKKQLEELASWTSEHEIAWKKVDKDLAELNKPLLQTNIGNVTRQITELDNLLSKLRRLESTFSISTVERFSNVSKQIMMLNALKKEGISEIAAKNGVAFYQSKEFQNFIIAAENYIKVLGGDDYPNRPDEICVYCQQPLIEQRSQELIRSYRSVLKDNSDAKLNALQIELNATRNAVKAVDSALELHQPSFGVKDGGCVQPDELQVLKSNLVKLQGAILDGDLTYLEQYEFNCEKAIAVIQGKLNECKNHLATMNERLGGLNLQEQKIRVNRSELADRKLLHANKADVPRLIENKLIVHKLLKAKPSLQSTALSRKTTQAREELVSGNFSSIFQSEVRELRKSQIKIDLDFGTEKGQSKMRQVIGTGHSLQDVLSEGEQKAIALAEFLTELQLDNSLAPVIFDDPVNSLDHHLIEDVARRLIKLSKDRQVVIFTHSVLLYNFLLYCLNGKHPTYKKEFDCIMYDVATEKGYTGVLTSSEAGKNTVTYYIKRINSVLNNRPKEMSDSDAASLGYGYLRSAIEISVENEMLSGTVVRYQKNVMLMNFGKLKTALIEQHKDKVYEIFERCCAFLPGHSNPQEIATEPTIDDLTADFNAFEEIRRAFN